VLLVMLVMVAPEGIFVPPTFQPTCNPVVVPDVSVMVVVPFVDPTIIGVSMKFTSAM